MKQFVIIVAGGSGSRMKSEIPKQFMLLKNIPVLMHTIKKNFDFNSAISIIVVLPESQIDYWKKLCVDYKFTIHHTCIAGGKTRFHSVKNGLNIIAENGLVAVHDGVRPLVSNQTIQNVFSVAEQKGNAIPCLPLNDSIRIVEGENSSAVLRSKYRLIQTPQCFSSSLIKKAFEQTYNDSFTDCASVVEAMGEKINLVEGNPENIKITTPSDLLIAESLLA